MMREKRSVCVILNGLNQTNWSLQPWRYLSEIAVQLYKIGHPVTILTQTGSTKRSLEEMRGVAVQHVHSIHCFSLFGNQELDRTISTINPDVILWSVGVTSFLHQQYPKRSDRIQIGIFSSPIYSLKDLVRIGILKLAVNYSLSGIHVLGSLCPSWLLQKRAKLFKLSCLVTQTETTRRALVERIWPGRVHTISPAVDDIWRLPGGSGSMVRSRFGFTANDFVVVYFGSPAPLRGLPLLVRAVAIARRQKPEIKLLILNRRRENELKRETAELQALIKRLDLENSIHIIHGYLEPESLVEICSACSAVALPFELLPSDAPLSILESLSLGKPLITTRIACLPELVNGRQAYLVEPGSVSSLAEALIKASEGQAIEDNKIELFEHPSFIRTWPQVGREWSNLIESL